jgi:predicted Zn-dependent peptidase
MYFYEKNKLKMSGLYLIYNAGSIYEKDTQKGTMHLMEHLICKTFDDMQDELTSRNVEYNAYTSEESVVVHFTGLYTELNADLKTRLVKRLTDGSFANETDFEKEKDIVLQEYYNYFNDIAAGKVTNNLRRKYGTYSVIGDAEDITNFTYSDALEIFDRFFKTPTHIVEVGRDTTDFSFVEYNDIECSKARLKYGYYDYPMEIVPDSETNSVVIAMTKKPISKKDYPYIMVLNAILSDGLNSPLYQELREKRGLIYAIMPYCMSCVNESVFMYVAMTTKDNEIEVANIMEDVLNNLHQYITPQRFKDVVNNCLIEREINEIFRYKRPKALRTGLASPFKTKKQFESLTLEKLIEVGKKYFTNLDVEIL